MTKELGFGCPRASRRSRSPRCLALALAALLAWPQLALAGGPEEDPLEAQARALLEGGDAARAVSLLKNQTRGSRARALLLARAYQDQGNDIWAMRTLMQRLEEAPEDCEARSWLALLQVRQGAFDEAHETLGGELCADAPGMAVRHALIETIIASTTGQGDQGLGALERAWRSDAAFGEDRQALLQLRPKIDPSYAPFLTGRVELNAGWASNALGGLPNDLQAAQAASGADTSSALGQVAAVVRSTWPGTGSVRGRLEGELRLHGNGAEAARDFSYGLVSVRPAAVFGRGQDLLLGYRYESLRLAGGDRYEPGSYVFYDAHRLEAELALSPWLSAFGGAGRRGFRELGRTRWEADLGLGATTRLGEAYSLMAALTARRYDARVPEYDQWGLLGLLSAERRFARGFRLRAGLIVTVEDYLNAAPSAPVAREDRLLKVSLSGWSPWWSGVRVGATYELSRRFSNLPAFEYVDHRLLAKVVGSLTAEPGGPRALADPRHVPLAWGIDEAGGMEESLQELLRQDEAMRRGSSCME